MTANTTKTLKERVELLKNQPIDMAERFKGELFVVDALAFAEAKQIIHALTAEGNRKDGILMEVLKYLNHENSIYDENAALKKCKSQDERAVHLINGPMWREKIIKSINQAVKE